MSFPSTFCIRFPIVESWQCSYPEGGWRKQFYPFSFSSRVLHGRTQPPTGIKAVGRQTRLMCKYPIGQTTLIYFPHWSLPGVQTMFGICGCEYFFLFLCCQAILRACLVQKSQTEGLKVAEAPLSSQIHEQKNLCLNLGPIISISAKSDAESARWQPVRG